VVTRAKVEGITLDIEDPFEFALSQMVEMNRRKREDYAADDDIFSNFRDSSDMGLEGFSEIEAAEHNVRQKLARIKSLRLNGRLEETNNETVGDTYLDLAVYAAITLALYQEALAEASA
jgi:hypothetical protein